MDHFRSFRALRGLPVCLLACLLVAPPLRGQTKQTIPIPDLQALTSGTKTPTRGLETKPAVPVDAPVDPSEYFVGPGDQIAVNVWSSSPTEYQLTISPEATVLLPNVGVVDVKGLTLAEAKQRIDDLLKRKFVNTTVTVTLQTPRKVIVDISGYVLNEGKKEVNAVERVDQLIAECNALPQDRMTFEDYSREILRLRKEASDRHILIRGRDGVVHRADIPLYRGTGIGKLNPYLREGDVVYVPQRKVTNIAIGIFGAVKHDADFEFVEGDSLSFLVKMGLGFRQDSDPEHATLTRLSPDGKTMTTEEVNLKALLAHRVPDIALRPGDRVVIPVTPPTNRDFHVTVEGEVRSPGSYPISRSSTRLSTVIGFAGGVLRDANLGAAVVYRNRYASSDADAGLKREVLLSERSGLDIEDTTSYRVESMIRINEEVLSVDFARLLIDGDSTQDAVLRNGDRIVIPAATHTVYVFGQVRSPGYVPFTAGADVDEYVARAGGFTDEAKSGNVKVIKASTRAWLDPSETTVEDGDLIWIPREPVRPFSYYMTIYAQVASIVAAIATVALLVRSL
jgi:protein involved in polysaccharide export with SLBB domain